jgi:ketosteroid isomerase-like protein
MTADREQITECLRDYFEGWFTGDATRMDRALHPELVKRSPHMDPRLERATTKGRMVELTAQGEGTSLTEDPRIEIDVTDVYGDIATAVVRSSVYREYVHLVRADNCWRIANALWVPTSV